MNGAELPDGSTLRVQPASSNHSYKQYGSAILQKQEATVEEEEEAEVDEELDDFFAGL